MARQKSDIPPAVRLRENQRRSRARRKDLIEDLKRQVREYEQRDVQATLLVQAAARKVAWENVRLRRLLVSRGVPPQDIDELIHADGGLDSKAPSEKPTQPTQNQQGTSRLPQDDVKCWGTKSGAKAPDGKSSVAEVRPMQSPTVPSGCNSAPIFPPHGRQQLAMSVTDGSAFENSNPGSDTIDYVPQMNKDDLDPLPVISDCFCPVDTTTAHPRVTETMLEMSCETAAGIIAGLRADGDMNLARSMLGCIEGSDCNVKNVHVLQIMDH